MPPVDQASPSTPDRSPDGPHGPVDVVAIGSAIVDSLARVPRSALEQAGLDPGTMTLVGPDEAKRLWEVADGARVAGGSAANTAVGVASLGGRAGFIGRLGDDDLGPFFADDLRSAGVLFEAPPPAVGVLTGRCTVFVTPDGERTMRTHLGAGPLLDEGCINESVVSRAGIVYLEGYLWDAEDALPALHRAVELAAAGGGQVALSLSDPGCVERHRDAFRALIGSGAVGVLFANESEILALTGAPYFDAAAGAVRGDCRIAALTRSEQGSVVVTAEETIAVPARPTTVVDTTGAGDLYAAGFMVGLRRGLGLDGCARLGSLAASEVISVLGARPPRPLLGAARDAGLL